MKIKNLTSEEIRVIEKRIENAQKKIEKKMERYMLDHKTSKFLNNEYNKFTKLLDKINVELDQRVAN